MAEWVNFTTTVVFILGIIIGLFSWRLFNYLVPKEIFSVPLKGKIYTVIFVAKSEDPSSPGYCLIDDKNFPGLNVNPGGKRVHFNGKFFDFFSRLDEKRP